MTITKRQLKRLIKEERRKLFNEANSDGTISDEEDDEQLMLLATVEERTNELIQHVVDEAERIGGGFRSPGIRRQAFRLMADMIHSYR